MDAPSIALWVFGPILTLQQADSAVRHLSIEERRTWWRALYDLAISIVRDGPSREVDELFAAMARSPLLEGLQERDYRELIAALRERVQASASDVRDYHWRAALAHAANVVEALAKNERDVSRIDGLYRIVSAWAEPPLSIERAGVAAKRIRE
jgi:hypothetical protein